MDLIEIIGHYQFVLKNRGREEGKTLLGHMGVHLVIRKAIITCFNDDGSRAEKSPCEIVNRDIDDENVERSDEN